MSNPFGWLTPPGCSLNDTGPMGEDDYKCEVCGRTCEQGELDPGEEDAVCRECKALEKAEKVGHTPGPWGFHPMTDALIVADYEETDSMAHYSEICEVGSTAGLRNGDQAANARLIAAAPALLAALEQAVDEGHATYCSAHQGPPGEQWLEEEKCNCFMQKARAALALARGGAK